MASALVDLGNVRILKLGEVSQLGVQRDRSGSISTKVPLSTIGPRA